MWLMSYRMIQSLALAWVLGSFSCLASAIVLGKTEVIAPLSPIAKSEQLNISASGKVDPHLPIWASYHLIAISSSEKPEGKVVVEAMPEGVKTPIGDSVIVFSSDNMDLAVKSGHFASKFEQQAGKKTQQELVDTFGVELAQSIKALQENKGAILEKTIVKQYPATGIDEARLLVSIEKAEGIHPAYISITMGQGEVPESLKASGPMGGDKPEKIVTALIAFIIAGIYLYKKYSH